MYVAGPHSPNIAGEEFQDKWLPPFESDKARATRRKMRQAPQLVEQVQRLWEVPLSITLTLTLTPTLTLTLTLTLTPTLPLPWPGVALQVS